MAKEYIEREAAYQTLTEYYHHTTEGMHSALREAISRVPVADVRPVRRGKWILYQDRDSTGKFEYVQWNCSACKSNVRTGQPRFDSTLRERPRFNFRPNCGADMREES